MGLFGYVNRFPEISHLPELEQRKLLETAHQRLFDNWRTVLVGYGFSALLVLICIGVGVGVAWMTGWSRLAGGIAATVVIVVAMMMFERVYARRLQRTVQSMIHSQPASQ